VPVDSGVDEEYEVYVFFSVMLYQVLYNQAVNPTVQLNNITPQVERRP
jgi:hypothetical protein